MKYKLAVGILCPGFLAEHHRMTTYVTTLVFPEPVVIVGYTFNGEEATATLCATGRVAVDDLDGSSSDGDGTDLDVVVHLAPDGLSMTMETLGDDAAQWAYLPGGAQAALDEYAACAKGWLFDGMGEFDVVIPGMTEGHVWPRAALLVQEPQMASAFGIGLTGAGPKI